ncbi:MAG: hypothetical protein QXP53_02460 [Candidatus Pacearchaeota archaeon]
MTILQKFDRRKRELKIFSIPVLPLLIILVLLVVLLLLPSQKIVSRVTSEFTLNRIYYNASQNLDGRIKINFSAGEFLPYTTNVSFLITAFYPLYYVCEGGSAYEMIDINGTYLGETDWQYAEYDFCGGDYSFVVRKCRDYNKTCCPYGVQGKVYFNLNCSNTPEPQGFCGDYCVPSSSSFNPIFSLQELISKSSTPDKGNFTQAVYKFFNRTSGRLENLSGTLSGQGVGYCFNTSSVEPQPRSLVLFACNDSDGNLTVSNQTFTKGNCKDWLGRDVNDSCSDSGVLEWYCDRLRIRAYPCDNCVNITCTGAGLSQGWYADCDGDPKNGAETLIKYELCQGLDPRYYAPICESGGPGDSYWLDAPSCTNFTRSCDLGCNEGKCNMQESSCAGWNNQYSIPLGTGGIGLKTPSKTAYYLVVANFNYNNTFLVEPDSVRAGFFVIAQEMHRECRNYRCEYVNGSGENGCDSDADCNCTPEWGNCTDWSECVNNMQNQTCIDLRCGFGVRTFLRNCSMCTPSWSCSWQYCRGNLQEKVCTDLASCDPNNLSYVEETRTCCVEDWSCSKWSKCQNNIQTRACDEINGCGTQFNKPAEQQSCRKTSNLLFIVLIIIVAVVVIFLFVMKTKIVEFFSKKYFKTSRPISGAGQVVARATSQATEKNKFDELLEYIKKALRAGLSKQDIESRLLEKGWPKSMVDRAFESLLA